jgi:hypothetical protein
MRGHVLQNREQSVDDSAVLRQKGRSMGDDDDDDGCEARSSHETSAVARRIAL